LLPVCRHTSCNDDAEPLGKLLVPAPAELLVARPVSTAVNSTRNDGSGLLRRPLEPALYTSISPGTQAAIAGLPANPGTLPHPGTAMNSRSRARTAPYACVVGDISLVRALGIRKLPVAVATSEGDAKCLRSRYCRIVVKTPSWFREPEAAVTAIIEWARQQASLPVLFYQGDHDLVAISRARERLAPHFRFVLPSAELVEDLTDKVRFFALARRHDLLVPDTLAVPLGAGASKALQQWDRFPCVCKPARRPENWYEFIGRYQKALHIETRGELEGLLPKIEASNARFLIQASVEGGEENILSYHAYVRPSGEIVAEFTGRKIRTAPKVYGRSTYVEITDDREVRDLGRATVANLGFSGVLKIDFKRDRRDNRLYMLEINPRFNLWHHPATVAGVGIPEAVFWDCVEPETVEPMKSAKKGVRWMAPMSDARAFGEYHASGQLSRARWVFEMLTVEVNEGFQISDPMPMIADVTRLLTRMFPKDRRMVVDLP
jgi:D-aspartate ligase